MKKVLLVVLVIVVALGVSLWMSSGGKEELKDVASETNEAAESAASDADGEAGSGEEEDSLETLIADLEKILEDNNVPGAGIAIVSEDAPIWVGGLGMADTVNEVPADENTFFRIGSISKMFASLSLLKLQEEGRVDLQDPLSKYVDDVEWQNRWAETHPIRLVHLLEHSTGFDDLHINEYALSEPDIGLKDAYAFNPRGRESRWRPGDFATYSNANPPLGAYVVEKVTDQDFERYVREQFFDPLGMEFADYKLTSDVKERLANGYDDKGKNRTAVDYWHIIMRPSGSINTSAAEMANWLKFYLNRGAFEGTRILSEASIDRMEIPTTTLAARTGLEFGYGLNNYTKNSHGFVWHGHNGGMMGFVADMSYSPELGVGFAVMINRASGALNQIGNRIAKFLVAGKEKPSYAADVDLSEEELKKFTGFYRKATTRMQMQFGMERLFFKVISVQGKHLKVVGVPSDGFKLHPVEGGHFRYNKQPMPTVAFFEDEDGKFYYERAPFGSMVKISPISAWGQLILAVVCVVLVISSVILLPMYGIGRAVGYFKGVQDWGVRLCPGIAAACGLLSIVLFIAVASGGNASMFTNFGQLSVVGLITYILDWGTRIFIVLGAAKLIHVYVQRLEMKCFLKVYLVAVNVAGVLYLAYTTYWSPVLPLWMW